MTQHPELSWSPDVDQNGPGPHLVLTIEGPDGSGKSTLAQAWFHWCLNQGRAAGLWREPGGSETGELLRSALRAYGQASGPGHDEVRALIFQASRAAAFRDQNDWLATKERGMVIRDRSWPSTIVYQGAIATELGNMGLKELPQLHAAGHQVRIYQSLNLDAGSLMARADDLDFSAGRQIAQRYTEAARRQGWWQEDSLERPVSPQLEVWAMNRAQAIGLRDPHKLAQRLQGLEDTWQAWSTQS